MIIFDTIVSQTTANFKAAIGVVRLVGPLAFEILSHLVKKDVSKMEERIAYLGKIYEDKDNEDSIIDQAMYVIYKGKKSFCGEDTVEFYLHGSLLIISQVVQACCKYGARQATNGEFSMKAFYNGKLDLTEAEAINQLINAKTNRSKKFALNSLQGRTSNLLKELKNDLNMIEAEIEVNIDYPEFDEDVDLVSKVETLLPDLIIKAKNLLTKSKESLYLFNGIKVAIVGEPNVGKSTLLNNLLQEDKAIVTEIPGTTRDVVEGEKEYNGLLYHFYDTAGIREADDKIEKIGIEKSYKATINADIVLVLSTKISGVEELKKLNLESLINSNKVIYIATKKDLYGETLKADLTISNKDKNYNQIYEKINEKLNISNLDEEGLTSEREVTILNKFISILEEIHNDLENQITIDVVEIKLVEATKLIDSLLGVDSSLEDIYSTIFKHFCVGK